MGAAALVGMQMAGSYMSNKRAKKGSKLQKRAQAREAQYYQKWASPENFNNLTNQYRSQMQGAYLPQMRQLGDVLGLNEANAQQQFNADTARRGLSGSGMAFAGQNSIRAARMAGLGQAQQQYQMDVENAARQQAQNTINQQLQGASQFNPYQYVEQAPSTLEALLNGTSGALGTAANYGLYTGSSGNFGSLIGLKGGPMPAGYQGPTQPYYIGNQPGRG